MEYYTTDSNESDISGDDRTFLDLSYQGAETATNYEHPSPKDIRTFLVYHNNLMILPAYVESFTQLRYLDISSNQLTEIPEYLCSCPLTTLIAKNNRFSIRGLPAALSKMSSLRELNLNGNQLRVFPPQILHLTGLRFLHLGANHITHIPHDIPRLHSLEVLTLGGNLLTDVPASVGELRNLTGLILSDNQLTSLPASIANLNNLISLLLHKNRLRTLPTEIVSLKGLIELSLRDNPLVVRFVSDMEHSVPSLLELSARTIKLHSVPYFPHDLPTRLADYLASAHHCINSKCKGVFFDNRVEHVKFVDFCGKYRVPLLQYLCSSSCINEEDDIAIAPEMMRRVLLG